MRYFACFLFLLLLAACKQGEQHSVIIAPTEAAVIKDSSYSKCYISANQVYKEIVDYIDFDYPFLNEKNSGTLKISKVSSSNKDRSNLQSSIRIQPVYFASKSKSAKNYTVMIAADEIVYRDASLFAKKNGTDSTEDHYTVLNPLSGEVLMQCTNDYYDLVIPNSKERRYIGFLSTKREKDAGTPIIKNSLGSLFYASSFSNIQRIEIQVKSDSLYKSFSLYTPKIELKTLNSAYSIIDDGRRIALMNISENNKSGDFSNMQVLITFYYGSEVKELVCIIPITDDQLDLKSAFFDKKIVDIK